jgi:hypothetical protein
MGDPVRDGFIAAAEVARRKFEECKAWLVRSTR